MNLKNKVVMFDLDGCLYRGTMVLPHASDAVSLARKQGMKVGFITNNSSKTPEMFTERLNGYGIEAYVDEVMTSAIATAEYIRATYGEGGTAFVIGQEGCHEALASIKVETVGLDDDRRCDYVVVGMSPDFSYSHLVRAQQEILVNGAIFIGTNADRTFPWNDGTLRPGAGTMVAAVEACTYVTPIVMGKPKVYMIEQMSKRFGFKPDECLVVGDRIDTDIIFGNRYGAHTLLVLTGISTREEAEKAEGERKPEFILDTLEGFDEVVKSIWG